MMEKLKADRAMVMDDLHIRYSNFKMLHPCISEVFSIVNFEAF